MTKKKVIILIPILLVVLLVIGYIVLRKVEPTNNSLTGSNNNQEDGETNMTEDAKKLHINININGVNYTATLENNETAQEFQRRLPLSINMGELNNNEKYYYFDNSLPSNSSRIGRIEIGDIMLYGSDCLVLFYDSFNTSYSYTRIGKLDDATNLKDIVGTGSIQITFSVAE